MKNIWKIFSCGLLICFAFLFNGCGGGGGGGGAVPENQTISFGVLTPKTLGDAPFIVTATASSGLPVSFSIVSGPASISGNTVTITGVGTVLVRASQSGNASFNPAPNVDQSFIVSSSITLKFRTYSAATVPVPGEITAVGFRVLLPQGVSVATDPTDPRVVATGALNLSGIFTQLPFKNYTSYVQGSYSSAKPVGTGRDAIRVNFVLQSKSFTVGEFLTINGSAVPGSLTAKGDYTLSELILGGVNAVELLVPTQYKFDFTAQ